MINSYGSIQVIAVSVSAVAFWVVSFVIVYGYTNIGKFYNNRMQLCEIIFIGQAKGLIIRNGFSQIYANKSAENRRKKIRSANTFKAYYHPVFQLILQLAKCQFCRNLRSSSPKFCGKSIFSFQISGNLLKGYEWR